MGGRTGLLVAYDAESAPCRRFVDWVGARDRNGSIVFFPLQNPELVRLAPELAGRPLHGEVHGIDLGGRQVRSGAALLPWVLARLPSWGWAALALRLPGLGPAAAWLWSRRIARTRERQGRQPFQDRF